MGTATRKLSDGANKKGWLVRNEQGETFGPVDFETLKAWACDGRLAPTNEVSENGVDWLFATASCPLEMNWVAEVTPGTFYGPIHRQAMEGLVQDGSIARASAFFTRCGLDGKLERGPDGVQAERIKLLTEQHAQAQQQAAASEGQLREAHRQVCELEGQLREARRLASGFEAQAREASGLAEQARQQAAAGERQLQAQLAEREEQAQRRVAAYEEQLRLAQQQVGAYAEQVDQIRQQASAAEAHLRAAVQQQAEQAEQARTVQQQWVAKADGLSDELESVRKAHAELVSRAAELRAEHAAESAAREARERALEAERQQAAAALAQARAEAAAQDARLARLEAERQMAGSAASEHGETELRLRTVSAELAGIRQALACEKEAAQQAEARCAALESALQAAQARDGDRAAMSDGVSVELRQMRQQIEALAALVRDAQVERERSARAERPAAPQVERVYVEAEPVEVLPPENRSSAKNVPPADPVRTAPEGSAKPSDPPKAVPAGRAGAGISMAELEQQARRELERLGSQGANLFKRKK